MTSEAGGAITLLGGAITLRLALTGDYKRYVRPGMGPLLVIAGVILIALGLVVVVRALRPRPGAPHHHDTEQDHSAPDGEEDDDEHRPERVGWLVLAPVLAVLLVAPPALGAFAVNRTSRVEITGGALFDALPTTGANHQMTLVEFLQRAADRDGASMAGSTVAARSASSPMGATVASSWPATPSPVARRTPPPQWSTSGTTARRPAATHGSG